MLKWRSKAQRRAECRQTEAKWFSPSDLRLIKMGKQPKRRWASSEATMMKASKVYQGGKASPK